jgi:putative transposase
MRKENFAPNEYYHLHNRGVNQGNIFLDDTDRIRFIFLLTHLQSPLQINNISWYTKNFIKNGAFNLDEKKLEKIFKKRHIELVAFALMPNHFHIIIKNLEDSIASVYMQRILTSYSKYFNTKYKKQGHVFEGPFRAVHIKKGESPLQYLSDYIQKDPKIFVKRSFKTVGFAEPFVSFIP